MSAPEFHTVTRPELTLPPAETAWLSAMYAAAPVILEYGSGGSTVLAAEMPGKTLFSVESDQEWAAMMAAYFQAHPPAAQVHLHPVNIGATGKWGAPAGNGGWRRYHLYPLSVWDREDFVHPDLILIDGRFRAACLLTALMRAERPVTVLFDDDAERKRYHRVERWVERAETRGRMARFEVFPGTLPKRDLTEILSIFTMQQ